MMVFKSCVQLRKCEFTVMLGIIYKCRVVFIKPYFTYCEVSIYVCVQRKLIHACVLLRTSVCSAYAGRRMGSFTCQTSDSQAAD